MNSNQTITESENRTAERIPTLLRTIVQVKENENETWKEITEVNTVSRNGAGFTLSRECTVGRLVTLVTPMPPELRAYDKNTELYPVMGLVQYCNKVIVDGRTEYHVGVGFVGKGIPDSFKADPQQNYRICGMSKNGLWKITESESQFILRSQPRFWLSIDVTISLIKREKDSTKKENTFTKNISANGVSVPCSLEANIGDRVKFASIEYNFYTIAIVRNRKEVKDLPPTLHLEFIDSKFPIEKLIIAEMVGADQTDAQYPPPQESTAGQFEFHRN